MRKIVSALALAILAAIASSSLSLAGGWAVVTLDQLPPQIVAGEPVQISFMVRQHGVTPTNDFGPVVKAARGNGSESFTFNPQQQGVQGHYVARLTFPDAGEWHWSIQTLSLDQPMPPMTVLAPVPGKTTIPPPAPVSYPIPIAAAVALGIVGAAFVWLRTHRQLALAVGVTVAALGLAGFAVMTSPIVAPVAQTVPSQSIPQGKALFLAKGCVACHTNAAVADVSGSFRPIDVGPNLTNLSADPVFLRRWLKDPSAVKSGAAMPRLDLSDTEIEALVSFLISSHQ